MAGNIGHRPCPALGLGHGIQIAVGIVGAVDPGYDQVGSALCRIDTCREAIQFVIAMAKCLALGVGDAGTVAVGIISVGYAEISRAFDLGMTVAAVEFIVAVGDLLTIGIGLLDEVVPSVVLVDGGVTEGVLHLLQAVEFVILIGPLQPEGSGYTSPIAVLIVAIADGFSSRVGDNESWVSYPSSIKGL